VFPPIVVSKPFVPDMSGLSVNGVCPEDPGVPVVLIDVLEEEWDAPLFFCSLFIEHEAAKINTEQRLTEK